MSRLRKAILRPLHKLRLDVDAEGQITPVRLRLDPEGPPLIVREVLRVDDRITEVWYEVLDQEGDLLILRLERESLRCELHSVESEAPERFLGWSEVRPGSPPLPEGGQGGRRPPEQALPR